MDTRYTIHEGPGKYDVMLALFEGNEVTFTITHEHAVFGRDDYRRWKERVVLTGLVVSRYSHKRSVFDIRGYLVQSGRRGKNFEGRFDVGTRTGHIIVSDPLPLQPVQDDYDDEEENDPNDYEDVNPDEYGAIYAEENPIVEDQRGDAEALEEEFGI